MPTEQTRKTFLKLTSRQWFGLVVFVPTLCFVLTSFFIVIYATLPWPTGQTVAMQTIEDRTEELIVLVHGKGDHPSSWADRFSADLASSILGPRQQAVTIDWSEYSHDLFRSTLNARRIGHDLGNKLLAQKNIRRLHLIGHSAGSFVVYGICEAVRESGREIFVHSTYLDPVGIYAGLDWGFGPRNFGGCADISDAYIDRDDGVPGSNAPLENPHTFDVTALKKSAGFTGLAHLWPIEYYRQAVLSGKLSYWQPQEADLLGYPPQRHTVFE